MTIAPKPVRQDSWRIRSLKIVEKVKQPSTLLPESVARIRAAKAAGLNSPIELVKEAARSYLADKKQRDMKNTSSGVSKDPPKTARLIKPVVFVKATEASSKKTAIRKQRKFVNTNPFSPNLGPRNRGVRAQKLCFLTETEEKSRTPYGVLKNRPVIPAMEKFLNEEAKQLQSAVVLAAPMKPLEQLWLRTGYARLHNYLDGRFDDNQIKSLFKLFLANKPYLYRVCDILGVPKQGTLLANRLNGWYTRCASLDGLL